MTIVTLGDQSFALKCLVNKHLVGMMDMHSVHVLMLGGTSASGAYRHDLIFTEQGPLLVLGWADGKPMLSVLLDPKALQGPLPGDEGGYVYDQPIVHPTHKDTYARLDNHVAAQRTETLKNLRHPLGRPMPARTRLQS